MTNHANTASLEASPIQKLLATVESLSKLVGRALGRSKKTPLEAGIAYEIAFRSALSPRSILRAVKARAPELEWSLPDPRGSNRVEGRARNGIVVTIDPNETSWLATVEVPDRISPRECDRFLERVEVEIVGALGARP